MRSKSPDFNLYQYLMASPIDSPARAC